MGVVTLQRQGLIYEDDFSSSLDARWEAIPNDSSRYEVSGSLRLIHGADPVFLFFDPLTAEKQFVLDIKNNYNPSEDGDFGGIAVYANDTDYILLEEYFDSVAGTTKSYPWLRLVRDYNTYTGYWSEDGSTWNLIDTQEFDRVSPKIGVFLMGAAGVDLIVERVRIFRSTRVQVDNLEAGAKVELKDAAGAVVDTKICRTGQSSVQLNTASLPQPFTGRVSVTGTNLTVYNSTYDFTLWGGDQYSFEVTLDLYFLDDTVEKPLLKNIEEYLGYVNATPSRETQMILRGNGTFKNVTVDLEAYEGDDYQRLVDIAPDVSGAAGTYSKWLNLGTITNEARFWIKLSRETDPTRFKSDVHFGIKVHSQI